MNLPDKHEEFVLIEPQRIAEIKLLLRVAAEDDLSCRDKAEKLISYLEKAEKNSVVKLYCGDWKAKP